MVAGGTISFGGLASGLDTKNIVSKLTEIKQNQLIKPLEDQVKSYTEKKDAYTPIQAAYLDLQQKSRALKSTDNIVWTQKTGVSSDTDKIIISAIDSTKAATGTYDITNVTQLAQADRIYFNGVADRTSSTFGTGTISITYKGATTNIVIDSSNNTLYGINAAINNANAGVKSNIINDGNASTPYRLVLTSNDTGSDTTITKNFTALTLTTDAVTSAAALNEPQDASLTINGLTLTSKKNLISEAIQGVTFNLLDTNAGTTTLTVKKDTDKIAKSITDFIDSYTSLKKLLYDTTTLDPATGKFGTLGKDLTLIQSKIKIGSIFSTKFTSLTGNAYTALAEIGVTSDVYGTLKVDSSKLNTAIEDNVEDVQALFQGSTLENGIAEQMYTYLDTLTNAQGLISKKKDNIDRTVLRLNEQLKIRQKMVDAYEIKLFSKFNKLETVLSGLQNQQSAIDGFASAYSNSANRLL